jgi:hypothetical protein
MIAAREWHIEQRHFPYLRAGGEHPGVLLERRRQRGSCLGPIASGVRSIVSSTPMSAAGLEWDFSEFDRAG